MTGYKPDNGSPLLKRFHRQPCLQKCVRGISCHWRAERMRVNWREAKNGKQYRLSVRALSVASQQAANENTQFPSRVSAGCVLKMFPFGSQWAAAMLTQLLGRTCALTSKHDMRVRLCFFSSLPSPLSLTFCTGMWAAANRRVKPSESQNILDSPVRQLCPLGKAPPPAGHTQTQSSCEMLNWTLCLKETEAKAYWFGLLQLFRMLAIRHGVQKVVGHFVHILIWLGQELRQAADHTCWSHLLFIIIAIEYKWK